MLMDLVLMTYLRAASPELCLEQLSKSKYIQRSKKLERKNEKQMDIQLFLNKVNFQPGLWL